MFAASRKANSLAETSSSINRSSASMRSPLWQWITRKPKTASAAGPSAAPQLNTLLSGLGIISIFLNGFYDRGRVIDTTSLGNLLDLRHSMHGAGFDVELRGLRVKTSEPI